ncbi:hypothetical protein SORBI_3005G196450 [Sorghum bicolor]|uniref:Uncharacterized protein n=1 Tax=Sorghum bicolor TaxID=4558 RepID=A0A1Z5RJQ8_SORBI|nr:hypothetical protein SORBI_3005G196450 [Sorghum bicolor]
MCSVLTYSTSIRIALLSSSMPSPPLLLRYRLCWSPTFFSAAFLRVVHVVVGIGAPFPRTHEVAACPRPLVLPSSLHPLPTATSMPAPTIPVTVVPHSTGDEDDGGVSNHIGRRGISMEQAESRFGVEGKGGSYHLSSPYGAVRSATLDTVRRCGVWTLALGSDVRALAVPKKLGV